MLDTFGYIMEWVMFFALTVGAMGGLVFLVGEIMK